MLCQNYSIQIFVTSTTNGNAAQIALMGDLADTDWQNREFTERLLVQRSTFH
jgi:hypothetical protein